MSRFAGNPNGLYTDPSAPSYQKEVLFSSSPGMPRQEQQKARKKDISRTGLFQIVLIVVDLRNGESFLSTTNSRAYPEQATTLTVAYKSLRSQEVTSRSQC